MGVLFVVLLVLAVGVVVLDAVRERRSWQLVVAGLGFLGTAFGTRLTPWAGLAAVAVLAFTAQFLHSSRPRRSTVPTPQEVLATPEPASNVKLV